MCESVKWLKGAKLEVTEDALVIWIWQVHMKHWAASDEIIKK
jgi:hypothetical protein